VGALKLKEEQGAEVLMVDQDSPAGKAGLKEHDVILTLNGSEVESGAQPPPPDSTKRPPGEPSLWGFRAMASSKPSRPS